MAIFTSDNRQAWQELFDSVAGQCPSVGKRVRVTKSRKYANVTGTVIWHGWNKFGNVNRYSTDAQIALREAQGRRGFRVRVQPDGDCDITDQPFFVDADKVEVI